MQRHQARLQHDRMDACFSYDELLGHNSRLLGAAPGAKRAQFLQSFVIVSTRAAS